MHGIVLIGAPGSGKGTQAVLLAKELGIAHVSSGELFRESVGARRWLVGGVNRSQGEAARAKALRSSERHRGAAVRTELV